MRAPLLVSLVVAALALAHSRAGADCPDWKVGPFSTDAATTGANGTIGCTTTWDPDGDAGSAPTHLVIAGSFTSVEGIPAQGLADLDPLTGLWHAIPSPPDGPILAMTAFNNQLVVAGSFQHAGGLPANGIATWNGASWQPLSIGLAGGAVRALTVWNNELFAGGAFNSAGGLPVNHVAYWDGYQWQDPNGGVDGTVTCLEGYGSILAVGGTFSSAGGYWTPNIAAWDGGSWSPMSTGLPGLTPAGMQPFNGSLNVAVQTTSNGYPASQIAQWNGSGWQLSALFPLCTFESINAFQNALYVSGSNVAPANPVVFRYDGALHQLDADIYSGDASQLTLFGGELVVTGAFSLADSRTANNVARWDGNNWGTFGGGSVASVLATTLYQGRMLFGGDFHQPLAVGAEAHGIMGAYDGQRYAYGSGMDGAVAALKAYTTGTLYNTRKYVLVAGGYFSEAGGTTVNHIARWTESRIVFPAPTWTAMGAGFNGDVYAIERFNNQVYAAGTFTLSGSTPVSYIAKFNESTLQWEPVGGGVNFEVDALKVYGSSLYVGGKFWTAGGVATGGLARWDGTSWSAVDGPFSSGNVFSLEIHQNKLVIGGAFTGTVGSANLLQYDGSHVTGFPAGGTEDGSSVFALHSTGSRLYAGGSFTLVGGSVPASHLAWCDSTWHAVLDGVQGTSPFGNVATIANDGTLVNVGGDFTVEENATTNSPADVWFDETGIPAFATQPYTQALDPGSNATLTAVPDTGYTGLALQWYRNGHALSDGPTGTGSSLSGTHSENLTITHLTYTDFTNYTMVVSDACGADTSIVATLTSTTGVGAPSAGAATTFDALGPNPSAGSAHVYFTLARDARVRLAVRDVAGRLVREVDAGTLAAGHHEAAWDGRAAGGDRAHAGVYFVELQVDGHTDGTRRLTIVH